MQYLIGPFHLLNAQLYQKFAFYIMTKIRINPHLRLKKIQMLTVGWKLVRYILFENNQNWSFVSSNLLSCFIAVCYCYHVDIIKESPLLDFIWTLKVVVPSYLKRFHSLYIQPRLECNQTHLKTWVSVPDFCSNCPSPLDSLEVLPESPNTKKRSLRNLYIPSNCEIVKTRSLG